MPASPSGTVRLRSGRRYPMPAPPGTLATGCTHGPARDRRSSAQVDAAMNLPDLPSLILLLGAVAVFTAEAVHQARRAEKLELIFPRAAMRRG